LIRPNDNKDNESSDSSDSDNVTSFIIVAVVLIAIVIGLVVAIFIYQQRNKQLLNQVKHISFQQTNKQNKQNDNVDPNLLLHKSGDNNA